MISVAALVGPTAVGKTETSLAVAERLGAEIVSLDSMQVYRGMDVGTATPSEVERARVPHHLLDLFYPEEEVTVAGYRDLARAAIEDIAARGRMPLLVGGSGLYFRAVVDDLRFPPQAPEVRAALEAEAEATGPEALHARLAELDPQAAAKMTPGNTRRIVRALEIVETTGRRFSDFAGAWDRFDSIYELRVAGLARPREELYERIERRVDDMLVTGLRQEAEALKARAGRTARQALGYRQILDAPPAAPPEEVRAAIVRATKRFARRQESWFRADPRVVWFAASGEGIVDRLMRFFTGEHVRSEVPSGP